MAQPDLRGVCANISRLLPPSSGELRKREPSGFGPRPLPVLRKFEVTVKRMLEEGEEPPLPGRTPLLPLERGGLASEVARPSVGSEAEGGRVR